MNIKTFLAGVCHTIRQLFSSFPADLKTAIFTGVSVTENIKRFIDSPAADVLTAIIPGQTDDKIKQVLRGVIPLILKELKLAAECTGPADAQEITKCAVKALQNLQGAARNAFLHSISVMVAQAAADGKLSWSDGVYLAEWYYQNKYKKG